MALFFSLLALAANVATVAIVVSALTARRGPAPLLDALRGSELWLAFAVAAVATLGSLYLSEIAHLEPCKLCWFQRIAMYPLTVILGVAAWRRDAGVRLPGAILAGVGATVSVYHRLIQAFPGLEGTSCNPAVPCTAAYVQRFGVVTIPYMALSAFTLILALLWTHRRNTIADAPSFDEPTLQERA